MEHDEVTTRQLLYRVGVGQPGRERDDTADAGVPGGLQRGTAAHGVPDQHDRHRTVALTGRRQRELDVGDRIGGGLVPAAVPVADLADGEVAAERRDGAHERLHAADGQLPGLDRAPALRLPAVQDQDRGARGRGPRREVDERLGGSLTVHVVMPRPSHLLPLDHPRHLARPTGCRREGVRRRPGAG